MIVINIYNKVLISSGCPIGFTDCPGRFDCRPRESDDWPEGFDCRPGESEDCPEESTGWPGESDYWSVECDD